MQIPSTPHYWLVNAHIPHALLPLQPFATVDRAADIAPQPWRDRENLASVDLEIQNGVIRSICPGQSTKAADIPAIDLQGGMIFPCFVDLHTHLDKGHIWNRSPNLSGTFEEALSIVAADREQYWDAADVYRRMAFGIKCSYAHGTKAIRTHIDAFGKQAAISLSALQTLQQEWQERMILQPVSLVSLDYFMTSEGEKLADLIADAKGILGGLPLMGANLEAELDRVFTLAKERDLNLDFHTDESGNPGDITLRGVAAATIRHDYQNRVVCGHCCSLGIQSAVEAQKTIDLVRAAKIGIVSLPMCNLYLQDRNQQAKLLSNRLPGAHTPRWRGITLIHELKHAGVPVAIASDNCRDPFHGFGDHDALEVLTQSTRIAHLDSPYADWCRAITTTPADLMGLPKTGRIEIGLPADLVLFKARYYSELFSRPQSDRTVLRNGQAIDTTLPDYAELDDLFREVA